MSERASYNDEILNNIYETRKIMLPIVKTSLHRFQVTCISLGFMMNVVGHDDVCFYLFGPVCTGSLPLVLMKYLSSFSMLYPGSRPQQNIEKAA